MFNYVVKYLGILKHIPLLPLIFDSMMAVFYALFDRKRVERIEEIEQVLRTWEDVSVSMHKFGGIQFNVQQKELGHIHSNGLLDILFSKNIKENLIKEGKAVEHHVFKNSGWVSFYLKSEEDKNTAIQLLRYSYEYNLKRAK